jgi:flavin reductase (DIM6/NTAB) family NADH-FMN oxidoreductase RutF
MDSSEHNDSEHDDIVSLDPEQSFWERFYMVSPLVVIGTQNEDDDTYNLAPKHMAAPMGWDDYFGFVCTPRHKTYRNAVRTGVYTVSYPKPSQVVLASLAASPRTGDPEGPREKPSLNQLPTNDAQEVDGIFLEDAYLYLECEMDRHVDNLGENSLVIGAVKAVHVEKKALRVSEQDDDQVIRDNPLLAYLPPDRYATIDETKAFPFPAGFQK